MSSLRRLILCVLFLSISSMGWGKIIIFKGASFPMGPKSELSISPSGGYIAYTTDIKGNMEIYVSNIEGNFVVNVSNHPALDHHPKWARTRDVLLFESFRDGDSDIFRWDFGAQNPVDLTRNDTFDTAPVWSRNDSQILYTGDYLGKPGPMLMGEDGSNPRPLLAPEAMLAITDFAPYYDFNADGDSVVFSAAGDLWTLSLIDGEINNFMETEYIDVFPRFSPALPRIAFLAFERGFPAELHIIDPDGRNVKRVTNNLFWDFPPQYSPDGKYILYSSFKDGKGWEIYRYDVETGDEKVLTSPDNTNSRINTQPSWFPDGKRVVFLSRVKDLGQVCVMDENGRITDVGLESGCGK